MVILNKKLIKKDCYILQLYNINGCFKYLKYTVVTIDKIIKHYIIK